MKTQGAPQQQASHALSLIEGEFTAAEAREQLLELYQHNIRYHGKRNFASQIRQGNPDSYSESKLRELNDARLSTIELLRIADELGLKIKIESDIKVSLTQD
ncbi:MAG: hypothetical protein R3208_01885 [Ketobacteraceae bacterium]|nr:hypothetical protein [Ketobacteraceae bacterium]